MVFVNICICSVYRVSERERHDICSCVDVNLPVNWRETLFYLARHDSLRYIHSPPLNVPFRI